MADYTRLIELKVKDDALKRATVRLFRSLERIEKKLDVIGGKGGKGFDQITKGANRSAAAFERLNKTTNRISEASTGFRGFAKTYAVGLGLVAKGGYDAATALSHLGKAYMPLPALGKATVAGFATQKAALLGMAAAAPLAAKGVAALAASYVLFGSKTGDVLKGTFQFGKKVLGIFPAIHKEIGSFTQKIKLTSKAMEELQRGEGLTGLRTLLSKAVIEQDKLLTSNTGYVQALLKVRALEQDINRELIARQRITDNLVRKEGITAGPGIQGLETELGRQKEILSRMLTSQSIYVEQAKKVKSVETLITEEVKARDKVMNSLLTKQERLAKISTKIKNVAGKGAQFMRPGRGVEARGLGLAGLGVAGVGVHSGQMAAGITPSMMNPIASGVGGVAKAMGLGAIKGASFLGVLNAIGAAAMAHPQLIGLYATALMIWGNKANEIAIGPIKLLNKGLWGLGKALAQTHRPVDKLKAGLKSFSKESLEPVRMEFNLSAEAAKRFELAVNGVTKARARLRQTRIEAGHMKGSGFGAWSAKMDQREEGRRAFAERQVVRASAKRELQRTKGLKIEERINEVLKRRGKIMMANGQIQNIQQNKKGIFKGGAGGAVSSAMIGGGFPLLFGQGGASAVGGGIGGLVGGAIGGGFGFGLSIVGTALGQAYQKNLEFNKSLAVLNVRLKDTGDGSAITSKEIDALAKKMNITKQEAMGVLSAFSEFDSKGVRMSLTNIFGEDSGAATAIAQAQTQGALAEKIFEARKKIGNAKTEELLRQNLITDSATMELVLAKAIAVANHRTTIEKARQVGLMDHLNAAMRNATRSRWDKMLGNNIVKPIELAEERVKKLQAEFEKNKTKDAENFAEALREIRTLLDLVKDANELTDGTNELNEAWKNVNQTIRNDVQEGIKGLIKGTATWADMLNNVADKFLDIALNQALYGNMMGKMGKGGIFGAFAGIFGGGKKPTGGGKTPPGKAAGGPVTGGNSYVVGERGPELFVPRSGGNIVPNNAMGNVTVNVDASGSAAQGDGPSSEQLGQLIGAAIQNELIRQKRPGGLLG